MAWDHRARAASALVRCSRRAPQTAAPPHGRSAAHQEHAVAFCVLVHVSAVLVRCDAKHPKRCDEAAAPARVVGRGDVCQSLSEITQIGLGHPLGYYQIWVSAVPRQCPGGPEIHTAGALPGRCRGGSAPEDFVSRARRAAPRGAPAGPTGYPLFCAVSGRLPQLWNNAR